MSEYTKEDYAALYTKLSAVMADIGTVAKSGYNAFHKYNYAKDEDIVTAVRVALIKNQLMFAVSMRSLELRESVLEKKIETRATVHMDMTFLDCETGASITFPFSNAADDSGDKAVNKAITAAKKYFLIATFLISADDGDDTDADIDKTAAKGTQNGANQPRDRKSPPSTQNATAQSSGANSGNLKSTRVTQIKVVAVNDKNWIVADGDIWIPSRQMFRDIKLFECEEWTQPGDIYNLPYPVLIWWEAVKGDNGKKYRSGKHAETIKQAAE